MLLKKLIDYSRTDAYPFHMPGHKRQTGTELTSFPNPFSVDITEIDGFDNLHHPEEILKDSMERAAKIYGADHTYYMVNGSTGGILSAICAACEPGSRILLARNSHKSAYHAVMVNHLDPVFLWPEELPEYGIQGGISPKETDRLLTETEGIRAVFITSPTYEGIVSDVRAVSEVCHRHGVPLIVDEAHGAHFPFGSGFPDSALDCGADAVIQSLHKTLPSLTQTAVLHLKGNRIDSERLQRYLTVFQSSSPSYVFLSSIENCVFYMDGPGRKEMDNYEKRLRRFMERAGELLKLRVLGDDICGSSGVFRRDPSKLVIFPSEGSSVTGTDLSDRLRQQYHLESEMSCGRYVILMTSLMDPDEAYDRLYDALSEIDRSLDAAEEAPVREKTFCRETERILKPADAWNRETEEVPLKEAAGRICGTFVTVYPPGVPMLIPGERITPEAIRLAESSRKLGLTVEGIRDGIPVVPVIKQGRD